MTTLAATIVRQVVDAASMLPLPAGDTSVTRPPWRSRWEFERGGKVWRVSVVPSGPGPERSGDAREPAMDARDWIESLGDEQRWPEGTRFEVVVEEVRSP